MIIGGSEASSMLARVITRNALLDKKLTYQDVLLFLFANNDINGYTLITDEDRPYSDVYSYGSTWGNCTRSITRVSTLCIAMLLLL